MLTIVSARSPLTAGFRLVLLGAAVAGFMSVGCAHHGDSPKVLHLPSCTMHQTLLKVELDGPETVTVGDDFEYTIRLTNTGPYPLGHVTLHHVENEMFEMRGDKPTEWVAIEDEEGFWDFMVGHLEPDQTKIVKLYLKAKAAGEVDISTGVTYVPFGSVSTLMVD
jgi:hypothetical protein